MTDFFAERRYVKSPEIANDAAFQNYHACARLGAAALEPLQAPGASSVTCKLQFGATFATFAAAAAAEGAPTQCTAALPDPAAPGAKAKVVEAALKPGEDGCEVCGWKDAELTLSLSLSNPLVAAWKPPPKPAKTLRELVPPPPLPPPPPPRTATVAFRERVKGALLVPPRAGPDTSRIACKRLGRCRAGAGAVRRVC